MEKLLKRPAEQSPDGSNPICDPGPPTASRVAVATLFYVNGALVGTWVSRIPALEVERRLSHGSLGLALLGIAVGALVGMAPAGRLSARFGSHRVCQTAALLSALILPLNAAVPGIGLFALVLFLFGACHGALDVSMNAQAVTVERLYRRPIMSSFHALFSAGGLTGAASGGLIASYGIIPIWHFSGAALAAVGVILFVAFRRLIDDRESQPVQSPLAEPRRFSFPSQALLAIGAMAFATMVGEGAMADWSGVYLKHALGSNDGMAAAGYAAFSVTMAMTRFLGDDLTERLGPVGVVRLSGSLAVCGMSLALLATSPIAAIIGFALVGAGLAIVVPAAFSAAGRTPNVSPSAALSSVATIGYLGFLVGPPAIGFVAESAGLRSALTLILITSALIVALAPAVRGGRPAEPLVEGSAVNTPAPPQNGQSAERICLDKY